MAAATAPAWAGPDSVVTLNEIHYHPAEETAPEWVELHNQMSIRVDLGGWTLRGGINFTFPEGTVMEPGAYLVVSAAAGTPAGAMGPFTGRLNNAGDEIRLHERWGRMMDRVTYWDRGDWPAEADGKGPSLAKRSPDWGSEAFASWAASAQPGGTPGAENFPPVAAAPPRYLYNQGASWKYEPADTPPSGGWTGLEGFSDAAWASGSAPLGTGNGAPDLKTELPAGREAYYFRKLFALAEVPEGAVLLAAGTLKGTAEFFLNGEPLGTVAEAAGSGGIAGGEGLLRVGANVLAVRLSPTAQAPGAALDLSLAVVDGRVAVAPPLPAPLPGPVVINEINYHQRPTYADPGQDIAFAENGTEWIELHNPTEYAVDLSGWRLGDAVDFAFSDGTTLAPGGFLVVDHTQFSGGLANSSDRIQLRDAAGMLADEVRYFDSGRWPSLPDGGGSTLELADPRSDRRVAESWEASDETARAEWQTVTYRAPGSEPPGSNNPDNWREFLLGFLDAGEALIDDVSVIEDPDGARVQVIQNGSFENDAIGGGAAKWRLLGTHRLSHVVANPDGPGRVLRLIATGPLEHTYNNASTTFVGNRAISASRTYEISYRAKWLSGSPQLNSRLYLNRAAHTTILKQPASPGTPGGPNSRRVANRGPVFDGLRHEPLVPAANEMVRITVSAADPDGITSLVVKYRLNEGAWQEAPMGGDAQGRFFALLPGQANNTRVQFYLEAADGAGAASYFPPGGPESRALYKVGDGSISTQPVRNKLRLNMAAADAAQLHTPAHSVSNFRWPGTVIYNDREVWYDVGVRLRSAPYGRQGNRAGWNIKFGKDSPFRGVQTSAVIDGAFNMPRGDGQGWQENSLGATVNEMLYQAVANRAGGIPATYDDIIYFQTPRPAEGNRRAQLKMTRFGSSYLEEMFPNGDDGMMFKQELIYHPTATADGNPESLKNPYTSVRDTEIKRFGASKDNYRFNYLTENNQDKDDYSGIMALGQAFDNGQYAATSAVMDNDNWMRVSALTSLIGLADTYNNGLAHNIVLYVRPHDGKVMLFPWDQDHAFYYAPTSNIYGQGTHRLATVISRPQNRRLYAGHLRHLCGTAFTNAFLDPVINHLGQVAGKAEYSSVFRNWVAARRTYVLSQIDSQFPQVTFAIITNDGNDTSTGSPSFVLQGRGWIDVHGILVSRNGSAPALTAVSWLDGQRWQVTVPVVTGVNALSLTAVDHDGQPVGTDTISVTYTGTVEPAASSNLVISEIHYHPAENEEEEFIEVMNIGAKPVELSGARFTEGITFDFSTAPNTVLAPGERALVVKNRAAFEARYGASTRVLGEFAGGTQLANSGERLLLVDQGGGTIADVTYGDALPWPPEADGAGHSLTLIRPESAPASGSAASWRPSRAGGGTPGAEDSLSVIGYASLMEYAVAAAPALHVGADGAPVVMWKERLGADQVKTTPEVSADLAAWNDGAGVSLEITSAASTDGIRTLEARLNAPAGQAVFFRLRVQPR